MDTTAVIFLSFRVVFSVLLLVFVPGFALSLVFFPRKTDLSLIDRLVYTVVLSISSSIASLVFMDMVLGFDLTLENVALVVMVFSLILVLIWVGQRWYLNNRVQKRPETKPSEDDENLRRINSRARNAKKDQFRQDTRTIVIYHESVQSGANHIDHSYLLDVGEKIAIQQVSENKLKVTDSFIVEPPYPETQYFELIIREFSEDGLSQVDDLQIYPVFVTQKPDKRVQAKEQNQDTFEIVERIYQKTSSTEVQWIYSHDFHIFAIIHEEDTPDQMVDRILGKLDEIVTSTKSGIHISSHAEDRQILKDAFDTIIKKPSDIPYQAKKIPAPSYYQPATPSITIPRRPVILSDDLQEEAPRQPEVQTRVEPKEYPSRSTTLLRDELRDALKQPGYKPRRLSRERPEPKVIQPYFEQEVIPESPETQPPVLPEEQEQQVPLTSVEPSGIPITPDVQVRVESKRIPTRKDGQYRASSKKELTPPENKLVVDSIRKLQKDILRDLDMFGLTPDSFKKPGKDIQNVKIPKKADVNKKLASAKEEITDLDWLYE